MATKFIMPETFSHGKKGALQPNSIKEYTRLLNKLAQQGINSVDAILAPPKAGVPAGLVRTANAIYDLSPGTETKEKAVRRAYISAVHWVLPQMYRQKKKTPLYALFQRSLPTTDVATDQPWLPYKEYIKLHPEA